MKNELFQVVWPWWRGGRRIIRGLRFQHTLNIIKKYHRSFLKRDRCDQCGAQLVADDPHDGLCAVCDRAVQAVIEEERREVLEIINRYKANRHLSVF